ncbi:MAG: hypothetical protein L0220_21010, partial [Acidobacteria bacterium]|nr:hypothetical protein [Acidobacteriota bacterium]
MFIQLLTLLIILLVAYLLYRFTRSDFSRRGRINSYRPEFDFQIGRSVHLSRGRQGKSEALKKAASRLPFISLAFFGVLTTAHAQQTIFNVPSTDVLPQGKVYFELDTTYKFTDAEAVPSFYSFVPRVVVGAGKRMEMGLNINGNIQPGSDATTLSPTFKWKAYDGADNGWAFVVGDNLFIPVRNRSYDVGNYLYAEVSKTLKTKTRLTGGGYYFTPNVVAPN